MAKFKYKVTTNFNGPLGGLLRRSIYGGKAIRVDESTSKRIGEAVQFQILAMVSQGMSPVRGYGRFKGYAAQRGAKKRKNSKESFDRASYPYSVMRRFPAKQVRPVNLRLSGDFLEKLEWRPSPTGAFVGFFSPDQRTKALYNAHNLGTNEKRNVPQRKFLPTGSDEFVVTIQRIILDIYREFVRSILKSK